MFIANASSELNHSKFGQSVIFCYSFPSINSTEFNKISFHLYCKIDNPIVYSFFSSMRNYDFYISPFSNFYSFNSSRNCTVLVGFYNNSVNCPKTNCFINSFGVGSRKIISNYHNSFTESRTKFYPKIPFFVRKRIFQRRNFVFRKNKIIIWYSSFFKTCCRIKSYLSIWKNFFYCLKCLNIVKAKRRKSTLCSNSTLEPFFFQ